MKKIGTTILTICLNDKAGATLSKGVADELGLHFANAKDIVAYELFDADQLLKKCGVAYFKKREKSALKSLSVYENSVVFINYDLFINNESLFKKIVPKIYIKLAKQKLDKKTDYVNMIMFKERDEVLTKKCDMTINVNGASKSDVAKILKELSDKL